MAVRLKSVSINQTLRLASKALVASLLLYWLRSSGFGGGVTLLYILVFLLFYLKPTLNNGRFTPSAFSLLIIPFFLPLVSGPSEILFIASWGLSLFLLLGVKNLVLMQRKNSYRIVHFTIVAALGSLLLSRFGFLSQAVIFVTLLFVFREFYMTVTTADGERPTLIAALEAFIFVQISWVLSFLSTDVLVGGAFLTLFAFIFHDTTTHRLTGTLTKSIIVRNGALFGILTLVILIISIKGAII